MNLEWNLGAGLRVQKEGPAGIKSERRKLDIGYV